MKKAIDIVLLPSKEITEEAIRLNSSLAIKFPDNKTQLNKNNCLPHISLMMGVIDDKKIAEAQKILDRMADKFHSLKLEIYRVSIGTNPKNFIASSLDVRVTSELQSLHESIMNEFAELVSNDAKLEDVIDSVNVDPKTLSWINNYKVNSSFENFSSHITIGFGEIEMEVPRFFEASELAICHLGNFCTCREILAKVTLS